MFKKIILSLMLILLIFNSLFSQNEKQKKVKRLFQEKNIPHIIAKDTILYIKILKIKKIKGVETIEYNNGIKKKKRIAYIMQGSSEDNQGRTIISLSSTNNGNSKVKIGVKYKFYLIPYFYEDCFPGDGYEIIYINNVVITDVRVLGINIYTTPNLKGLYYVPLEDN